MSNKIYKLHFIAIDNNYKKTTTKWMNEDEMEYEINLCEDRDYPYCIQKKDLDI